MVQRRVLNTIGLLLDRGAKRNPNNAGHASYWFERQVNDIHAFFVGVPFRFAGGIEKENILSVDLPRQL